MAKRESIEAILQKYRFDDFRWMPAADIVVSQWVRVKCTFGCGSYGKKGTCPPQTPSVAECRQFFSEYQNALLIQFHESVDPPEKRHSWSRQINSELLKVEREVFLAGHPKAFLFFMDECCLCAECSGLKTACKNARQARPSPESFAVDVFETVRRQNYAIEVLSDYSQPMDRFAFLLVD